MFDHKFKEIEVQPGFVWGTGPTSCGRGYTSYQYGGWGMDPVRCLDPPALRREIRTRMPNSPRTSFSFPPLDLSPIPTNELNLEPPIARKKTVETAPSFKTSRIGSRASHVLPFWSMTGGWVQKLINSHKTNASLLSPTTKTSWMALLPPKRWLEAGPN